LGGRRARKANGLWIEIQSPFFLLLRGSSAEAQLRRSATVVLPF
jgi:hypothetical protein